MWKKGLTKIRKKIVVTSTIGIAFIFVLAVLLVPTIAIPLQANGQDVGRDVYYSPQKMYAPAADSNDHNYSRQEDWNKTQTYIGGEWVLYQDKIYRAKWWTQGEHPGQSVVWEEIKEMKEIKEIQEGKKTVLGKEEMEDFKRVGYYPSWQPNATEEIRYDVLTHIIYAFAIPTAEGKLRSLENPETARKIIREAHQNGDKVLLAVGGWSYQDVPLEATFVSATDTEAKREVLVDEIITMCEQYGFDGIDMDWEHPRVDGASGKQYEAFMMRLSEKLHAKNKLLTAAVVSGATADGNIYYDAAAQSDQVLHAVDWIHVMAYDGGDGERHSSYEFAVNCIQYWTKTRGLASNKVILGLPLYGRPGWVTYEKIVEADANAWNKDQALVNGMEVWYNGINTIQKKTIYAKENAGGVMVWEITQDTAAIEKSLLTAIGKSLQ